MKSAVSEPARAAPALGPEMTTQACASADVVGDRSYPVSLAQPNESAHQAPAKQKNQYGAEVDGRMAPGGLGIAAHGTVEGP